MLHARPRSLSWFPSDQHYRVTLKAKFLHEHPLRHFDTYMLYYLESSRDSKQKKPKQLQHFICGVITYVVVVFTRIFRERLLIFDVAKQTGESDLTCYAAALVAANVSRDGAIRRRAARSSSRRTRSFRLGGRCGRLQHAHGTLSGRHPKRRFTCNMRASLRINRWDAVST